MNNIIYFDNAASSPPLHEIVEDYIRLVRKYYANPNTTHISGLACNRLVEDAEKQVLEDINYENGRIIWTSSSTEAINLAISGFCTNDSGGEILISPLEHKAIINTANNLSEKHNIVIKLLEVEKTGLINLTKVKHLLSEKTRLIAIHHVNNELGVIQNINELLNLKEKYAPQAKILLDATQSLCKIPLDFSLSNIDFIASSSHKFHGIHGTGTLIYKKDIHLKPLIHGGYQQYNLHSGTLNVPGIIAYSKTVRTMLKNIKENLQKINLINNFLRKELSLLLKDKIIFHTKADITSAYILSIAIKGYQGAVIMRALGTHSVIVGTGSACLSEKRENNHVFRAIGTKKDLLFSTLRLSFGIQNTLNDAERFITILKQVLIDY